MRRTLPLTHFALAIAVVAVWGTNFVVIRIGLNHLPPLLFAALRFLLACLPGVFLLPRPAVPWSSLAAYGILIGAGQFGLLFLAMQTQISPGLASLVVQMQVFFTIGLSVWLRGERVQIAQWAALLIAASGIAVIALNADAQTTLLGLAMVLAAALSWAFGNMVAKRYPTSNMLAFVVWGSLFSFPPLLALSLAIEGPAAAWHGIAKAGGSTWAALLWQTVGNTLFGYAAWGWLLSRHPAASIVPMALLVPVFGMATSFVFLHESMPAWKLAAGALVVGGLALGMLAPAGPRPVR